MFPQWQMKKQNWKNTTQLLRKKKWSTEWKQISTEIKFQQILHEELNGTKHRFRLVMNSNLKKKRMRKNTRKKNIASHQRQYENITYSFLHMHEKE